MVSEDCPAGVTELACGELVELVPFGQVKEQRGRELL